MGSTYFDNYAIALQMYEGSYESNFSTGPYFEPKNLNYYHMYYITEELEIGYYSEIVEIAVSSKELSPVLKKGDDMITYSVYDNSAGSNVTKKLI